MNFIPINDFLKIENSPILHNVIIDKLPDLSESAALSVIAARPFWGKFCLALQLALNYALLEKKKIYLFSFKESVSETYARILRILLGNSFSLPDCQCLIEPDEIPIYICNEQFDIDEIDNIIRENIKDGMIFIDRVEMIKSHSIRRTFSKLKAAAQRYKLPIIITASLPRPPAPRDKPLLSDLKCNALADNVLFLHHEPFFKAGTGLSHDETYNHLIIAKANKQNPGILYLYD